MKMLAIIKSKVINTIGTTSGTFYILRPIADGLEKIGVTGTEFNSVAHIDGSECISSATCPTIKICRKGMRLDTGFRGKKVFEKIPEKDIVIKIEVYRCEGLEKLVYGEYFFSIG